MKASSRSFIGEDFIELEKSFQLKRNEQTDDNIVKTCVVCNAEKSFDNFQNRYRECIQCTT